MAQQPQVASSVLTDAKSLACLSPKPALFSLVQAASAAGRAHEVLLLGKARAFLCVRVAVAVGVTGRGLSPTIGGPSLCLGDHLRYRWCLPVFRFTLQVRKLRKRWPLVSPFMFCPESFVHSSFATSGHGRSVVFCQLPACQRCGSKQRTCS